MVFVKMMCALDVVIGSCFPESKMQCNNKDTAVMETQLTSLSERGRGLLGPIVIDIYYSMHPP